MAWSFGCVLANPTSIPHKCAVMWSYCFTLVITRGRWPEHFLGSFRCCSDTCASLAAIQVLNDYVDLNVTCLLSHTHTNNAESGEQRLLKTKPSSICTVPCT